MGRKGNDNSGLLPEYICRDRGRDAGGKLPASRPQLNVAELVGRVGADPGRLVTPDIIQLQRVIGNKACKRLLPDESGPKTPVSEGLFIRPPGDVYEQEADRLAGLALRNESVAAAPVSLPVTGAPAGLWFGDENASGLKSGIDAARGGGQPLTGDFGFRMEQSFGSELGRVRVHADSAADGLNRAIGARAFTTGRDIFFRRGEYNPESAEGQKILAHEITHVIQQSGRNGGAYESSALSPAVVQGVWLNDGDCMKWDELIQGRRWYWYKNQEFPDSFIFLVEDDDQNSEAIEELEGMPKSREEWFQVMENEGSFLNGILEPPITEPKIMDDLLKFPRGPMPEFTKQPSRDYPHHRFYRDLHDTKMVMEAFRERYPGSAPPPELVRGVYQRLNQYGVTCRYHIQITIDEVETTLGLPKTGYTWPEMPFIRDLTMLEGAFYWEKGPVFKEWLQSAGGALTANSRINCWEAILHSAIRAGLISKNDVMKVYQASSASDYRFANATGGVCTTAFEWEFFNLVGRKGHREINHPSGGANEIRVGDIIMLDGADGPLSHVVAVVAADPADYRNITVMSLWTPSAAACQSTAGGSLTQESLEVFLSDEYRLEMLGSTQTIRYASL